MLNYKTKSTMLRPRENSFGVLDNFKVGDVVLWSFLGEKLTGVVSDLYLESRGGREIAYATVFCFKNQHYIFEITPETVDKDPPTSKIFLQNSSIRNFRSEVA